MLLRKNRWPDIKRLVSYFLELKASIQIILLLFLLSTIVATAGGVAIYQLGIFSNDAFAINNLGVVRGSIQRTTKREIASVPSDPLITSIDKTIDLIRQRYVENNNDENLLRENISEKLDELVVSWNSLKKMYKTYRKDRSNKDEILLQSEVCWEKANFLTFSVQKISEEKLVSYRNLIISIAVIVSAFILLIMFTVYHIIHKHLEVDVITDSLTQLFNRSHFNQILDQQINLCRRYNYIFSLILVDIDYFKAINDEFGHHAGDVVLTKFAKLLKDNAREVDFVFRVGGEEFAVITPQCDVEQAKLIAEKYRILISESDFSIQKKMTVSAGTASYMNSETRDEFYVRTDKALYKAKDSGRNQVVTA